MQQTPHNSSTVQKSVLLLGNYRPTLILARVLAKHGYRVISGLEGCDGGAEYCKFVDQIWDHPSIDDEPVRFLDELHTIIAANDISVVFPVSENFVRFFAKSSENQPACVTIAMVDPQLAERCLDKFFMMNLATSNNVPTAPFATADAAKNLSDAATEVGFPLVVRPQDSTERLNGKKALFIDNADALSKQLSNFSDDQNNLILQKKAEGKRHNIYFAAQDGKVFRYSHAVILRTDNLDGSGLAVEGITIQATPDLRAYTEKLLRALNYTGIGCAQYLVDDKTGDISFLEINARIAGNHAVPENAGLNLSTILIDMAASRALDTTKIEGKSGIRYVWTRGDIEAVKGAWISREISNKAAIQWTLQAIWAALRADLHMTFDWRDPKPGLMAAKDLLPNWRKLFFRVLHGQLRGSISKNVTQT